MKPTFVFVAVFGLEIATLASCGTRTRIGEIPDAAGAGSNDLDGSGGNQPPAQGGAGGHLGAAGDGGRAGTGGRSSGQGGVPGNGGGWAAGGGGGGAGGMAACQAVKLEPGGQGGDPSGPCFEITYPSSGFYGDNILAAGCPAVHSGSPSPYEMAAHVPDGAKVLVKMTALPGSVSGVAGAGGSSPMNPGWGYSLDGDWRAGDYDRQTGEQVFQSRLIGDNETRLTFRGAGQARIDIYECDATTPTRSQILTWGP